MAESVKLVDFHLHFFPDKIAGKAMDILAAKADLAPFTNGTLADTEKKMDDWGVDKGVMLSIATNERQMKSVNNFAAEFLKSQKIIPFASVYPGAETELEELERIKSMGFKGIKLHPEYQDFEVADEKAFGIYEYAEKNNLIVMLHAGRDKGYPDSFLSPPKSIRAVHDTFPRLKIVAAHLGGWRAWEDVHRYLAGTDVFFDTSMTAGYIDEALMKKIVFKHGTERILFGSDCPWNSVPKTRALIESIGLSAGDLDKIYCQNALSIL